MNRTLIAGLMAFVYAALFVVLFAVALRFGGFRWASSIAFFGAIAMTSVPLSHTVRDEDEPRTAARVFRALLLLLVVISWGGEFLYLRSRGIDPLQLMNAP